MRNTPSEAENLQNPRDVKSHTKSINPIELVHFVCNPVTPITHHDHAPFTLGFYQRIWTTAMHSPPIPSSLYRKSVSSPANSTPVGPPPTTMNVKSSWIFHFSSSLNVKSLSSEKSMERKQIQENMFVFQRFTMPVNDFPTLLTMFLLHISLDIYNGLTSPNSSTSVMNPGLNNGSSNNWLCPN